MKPLNPIMAVLAIASVGVFPLRALAADGSKPAGAVVAVEDTNSIDALSKVLAGKPAARADAAARITKFLFDDFEVAGESGRKSFLAADVDAAARGIFGELVTAWSTKEGTPADVAVLYFVIGPGETVPSWAIEDALLSKTFKPGMKWEGKLRNSLAPGWTGESAVRKNQQRVDGFLLDAVKHSWLALNPASKEETDASIDRNDNTGVNVPNTAANTHLNGAIQHYTLKDLYVDGAETGNVAGPNDAHSRTISLKIYAKRMPDGSTVNEIGIFDITDVDNIYGRRFPVAGPDQSFVLDDRSPGHKKYELKFEVLPDGNRKIIFSRPGGGAQLETSVSELYNKRADQAAGLKNIISVGGEEFYVLPQGGARGAVAMFPKALIDGRGVPGQDPRNLVPKLYAEIGKRAADGRNQNLPGKPRLGKVGKTDYHLEFNEELGVWEVEEGEGDPLPTTPTTGDATGPAGANPGGDNTGAAPGPVPDGGYTFVDFVNKFLAGDIASGKCKINSDDMKDLAGDLKEKFGVVACQDERVGVQRIVIVPKTATSPNQQMDYSIPGFKLQGVRFYDHFLILQFDKQVQYLDLLKQDKDGNGKETGFAMSGFISDKKEASKFTDARALVDAFKHYMGTVPAAALTEVPRRVQAAVGGKPYYLTAGFPLGALTVNVQSGGETFNVWPEISRGGAAADPTPNPYTNLGGPANAMDGAVSSVPEAFKPEFDSAGWKAKLIGTLPNAEMKGIALYELSDPIGKDKNKKYQLSFRYKAMDPDGAKVFQMKPFEVFNSASPHPGAGLELQGLTAGPVVDDRVASGYKFVQGSKKERGVLAVFQNKQVSAANAKKGAANCVGPVLWWGLKDRDAAVKVCEEDKF